MDVKILDGDLVIRNDGTPETVDGVQLTAQQMLIALTVPKGCFVYDRNLGVFGLNGGTVSQQQRETVEMLLNENFVSSGIYIRINEISEEDNGQKLDFTIIKGSFETDSEVMING